MTLINKKFAPHPIKEMKVKNPKNTICETLRQAYHDIENNNFETAKTNIRIAITMAKAMSKKLETYKEGYADDFF